MKYKLKSGAEVSGSIEEIMKVAKALGEILDLSKLGAIPAGYYESSHDGLIKISDMNDMHIRNALLKLSKKHFETLGSQKSLSNKEFMKQYTELTDDKVVFDLFNELNKRK